MNNIGKVLHGDAQPRRSRNKFDMRRTIQRTLDGHFIHRVFLAVFALFVGLTPLTAFAAATSPQQAQKVVEGWLKTGQRHLGSPHGDR